MKFFILALFAVSCTAVPYGNSYSAGSYSAGSYGSGLSAAKLTTGYSGYSAGSYGLGSGLAVNNYKTRAVQVPAYNLLTVHASQPRQEVVQAAVQQLGRTIEYKAVPYADAPIEAQVIEVEPSEVPLHLHFKTKSSNLVASQSHIPAEIQEVQEATSQDEPTRLSMTINKPILQEVYETVSPFRQIQTEILPVQEAVHTVVTKAEGTRAQYQAKPYVAQNYQKYQTYQAKPVVAQTYQTYQAKPIVAQNTFKAFQVAQPVALEQTYQTYEAAQPSVVALNLKPVATATNFNQASY